MTRIRRESADISITHMEYSADADELRVTLDSTSRERAYVVGWNPGRTDSLRIVKHWGNDNVESTHDLSPNEAYDIARFVDASDVIAEAFEELRWESMCTSRPKRGGGSRG